MAASGRMILGASRVRQERYGRHVLWVLQVSVALAALLLFGAWSWRAPDLALSDLASAQPHSALRTPSSPRQP